MIPNRKFLFLIAVILAGLTNIARSQKSKKNDDDYNDDGDDYQYLDNALYDDNYNDVEVVQLATNPPKTKPTTKLMTTTTEAPETTSTSTVPLPINLMDQIANAIEVAEDDFDQSLNKKTVEVVKEPVESDLDKDDGEYDGELYDEGEAHVEVINSQAPTQIVKIELETDNSDSKEDESKEISIVKEERTDKLESAAQIKVEESVENKKTGFDLKQAYVIIPVASVLLVSMVLGTLLLLVKKTSLFKKKSTPTEGTRKQIYKSVNQEDPVV